MRLVVLAPRSCGWQCRLQASLPRRNIITAIQRTAVCDTMLAIKKRQFDVEAQCLIWQPHSSCISESDVSCFSGRSAAAAFLKWNIYHFMVLLNRFSFLSALEKKLFPALSMPSPARNMSILMVHTPMSFHQLKVKRLAILGAGDWTYFG